MAIERTRELLLQSNVHNAVLQLRDHGDFSAALPARLRGRVGAVMFNLGYLPRGDKSIRTQPESIVLALRAALGWLRAGGLATVVAYRGHPGGVEEAAAVESLLQQLSPEEFTVEARLGESGIPTAPILYSVRKNDRRAERLHTLRPETEAGSCSN